MISHLNFDLTPAQQIFAVFYAIFFGTMLQTVGARRSIPTTKDLEEKKFEIPSEEREYIKLTKLNSASLNLFDTPNAAAIGITRENKPLIRTFFAILLLNILPGTFFGLVFLVLARVGSINIWQIVFIVWISLAPQQIYRIFYAFLAKCYKKIYMNPNNKKQRIYKDYCDHDYAAVVMLWEDRLKFKAHKKSRFHLIFPLFIYFPTIFIFYPIIFSINLWFNYLYISTLITLISIGLVCFYCLND